MEKYFLFLLLFSIGSVSTVPFAFADHGQASVSIPEGSASPGCEETDECYIPSQVSIDVGGEVTWINDDSAAHTVTSGTPQDGPDGNFDSGLFMAGEEYSFVFDGFDAGEYPYFCMVHPWMAGTVVVQSEGEEPTSEKIEELGESSGEAIEESAEKLGAAVEESGEAVGESVEKGENMTAAAKEGTQEVGQEVEEASQEIGGEISETRDEVKDAGGCLIATATYGSELAPQVQQLRELRDSKLLQTEAGSSFMESFNSFYYSFSPYVADYERENPVFKEAVKLTITPMVTSLSILNHVDMDSEAKVVGYGISLIALNLGMYVVAPAIVIVGIKRKL